jgi:hypothetical protein
MQRNRLLLIELCPQPGAAAMAEAENEYAGHSAATADLVRVTGP